MEKQLKSYLDYIKDQSSKELIPAEVGKLKGSMLIQISFFQHERLVHLIVTITFAILTFLTLFFSILSDSFAGYLLLALLLILLIPYIRHYYILENGVQKLYQYYDQL